MNEDQPTLPGKTERPYAISAQAPRDVRLDRWEGWVNAEVNATVDPVCLPLAALKRMDGDPIAYLAEWAIMGLVRKPDLYHVTSPTGDKVLEAETEEWLWPLLPDLLPALARAFVYGVTPYVLDLGESDLHVRVPVKSGEKAGTGATRSKVRTGFRHFHKATELWPGEVELRVNAQNELVSLLDTRADRRYGAGRARVAVWDRQYGDWRGQAARRRAWPSFAKSRIFELLQARYLERSVHTPTVVYATGDTVYDSDSSSTEQPKVSDYIQEQLALLRGGGSMTLPGDRDESGNRMFELVPHELPERSEVWITALNRFDGRTLAAYLVPPAMAGLDDALGGGTGRVLEGLFATFVEGLVGFAARELTQIVEVVHLLNTTSSVPAPEVGGLALPAKVQKLYLEVFKEVAGASDAGAEVDVTQLLRHLGVPTRPREESDGEAGGDAKGGKPGRPRDATGGREERREDARSDEAADDNGAPDSGGRDG